MLSNLFNKRYQGILMPVLLAVLGAALFSSTKAANKPQTATAFETSVKVSPELSHDDGRMQGTLADFFQPFESEVKESESKDSQDTSTTASFNSLTANELSSAISPLSAPRPVVTPRLKFYLLFHSLKLDC